MNAKRFPFEGQMLTVREVCALVPALGRYTVRKNLEQGMTTRTQMLSVYQRRPKLPKNSLSRTSLGSGRNVT